MDCWYPVQIKNKGYEELSKKVAVLRRISETGEYDDCFRVGFCHNLGSLELLLSLTPEYVFVPCRKCPSCLKKRSREWAGRLLREFLYWDSRGRKTLFVTLTYTQKYIKYARKNYKKDLAEFFDKLRSKYRRSFRHWCIPELGEDTGRFHIHALIFDVPDEFAPDSHFHRSKNGALMGSNVIIRERWCKGIVDVGFLKEGKGAIYMSTYLTKITEASLVANDGIPFKGGIVCSNKLGFLDVGDSDLDSVIKDVYSGGSLMYNIGPWKFAYPYSWLKKYLTPTLLRYSSYNNSLKRYFKGGDFVFHQTYYKTYLEYQTALLTAVSGTRYYHKPVVYNNSIAENKFFDFEFIF